jgi:hypothetical protein
MHAFGGLDFSNYGVCKEENNQKGKKYPLTSHHT